MQDREPGNVDTNSYTTSANLANNAQCEAVRPIETAAIRNVLIQAVANGFIVTIGCKAFVATNWPDVASALDLYFKDPIAAEKRYVTRK